MPPQARPALLLRLTRQRAVTIASVECTGLGRLSSKTRATERRGIGPLFARWWWCGDVVGRQLSGVVRRRGLAYGGTPADASAPGPWGRATGTRGSSTRWAAGLGAS